MLGLFKRHKQEPEQEVPVADIKTVWNEPEREPEPEYQDKILICIGCGLTFVWEVGEQVFYHDRSLLPPRRCESCRKLRKSRGCATGTGEAVTK